jgi:HEAT repeat protein
MRQALMATLLISLGGCAQEQRKLAGDKWAEALRDDRPELRKKAAFTLGNIGPTDPAVLPALMSALQDTDASVRCEAILALLKCSSAAATAIPQLTELRDSDPDAQVREYAGKALERLQDSL